MAIKSVTDTIKKLKENNRVQEKQQSNGSQKSSNTQGSSASSGGAASSAPKASSGIDNSINIYDQTLTQTQPQSSERSQDKPASVFAESGSKKGDLSQLNTIAQAENAKDTDEIHGLSNEEYLALKAQAAQYGIEYEDLKHGAFDNVAQTAAKQIGKEWCYDTIAATYDSVLDLVLDEKLDNALRDLGVSREDYNWDSIVDKYGARLEKDYGIVFNKSSSRNFWVSLVDENGNVIQDENGNLAQIKKTDAILPDGLAQDVEKFASGLIDAMGYDCVSFLDLTPEEYEKVKQMASLDISNSELGTASDVKDKYKGLKGGGGHAANYDINAKSTDSWRSQVGGYFVGGSTGSTIDNLGLGSTLTSALDNHDYVEQGISEFLSNPEVKEALAQAEKAKTQTKESQTEEVQLDAHGKEITKDRERISNLEFEGLVQEQMEINGWSENKATDFILESYYII